MFKIVEAKTLKLRPGKYGKREKANPMETLQLDGHRQYPHNMGVLRNLGVQGRVPRCDPQSTLGSLEEKEFILKYIKVLKRARKFVWLAI